MQETEAARLRREVERLEAENKRLEAENRHLRETIHRAKDPSPVQRASFKRVSQLATSACMTLERLRSGWELKLGSLRRRFRGLKEIWEVLVREDWKLVDVFPPQDKERRSRPKMPQRHPAIAPPLRRHGVINYG